MPVSRKLKPLNRTPVIQRLAAYVNEHFDGNLTRAVEAIGCDYGALYRAANGLTRKPNLAMLTKVAEHSGRSLDWWIKGGDA